MMHFYEVPQVVACVGGTPVDCKDNIHNLYAYVIMVPGVGATTMDAEG